MYPASKGRIEANPSNLLEDLLTGGADEIVSKRLLQRKRDHRLESINLDEVSKEIAVVEPEQHSKETESSCGKSGVNT